MVLVIFFFISIMIIMLFLLVFLVFIRMLIHIVVMVVVIMMITAGPLVRAPVDMSEKHSSFSDKHADDEYDAINCNVGT